MIPVTIISGFVGAGKTTFLLKCLEHTKQQRRAIILNDIAETLSLRESVHASLDLSKDVLLEIANGCICCNREEQFLACLDHIAKQSFDHLFIEVNATGEPLLLQRCIERLAHSNFQLFSSVTVIDAQHFVRDYFSVETLLNRGLFAVPEDDRSIGEVLAEQVEHADTIVLAKEDLVSEKTIGQLWSLLHSLNPFAHLLHQKTSIYDHDALPFSFHFEANRPFHPERLYTLFQSTAFSSVLRAKGTAWLATRRNTRIFWSQAGSMVTLESDGEWGIHSDVPFPLKTATSHSFDVSQERFQSIDFLVFYGIQNLETHLTRCLLTDEEMSLQEDAWSYFDDPFDAWHDFMDRSRFIVQSSLQFTLS